MFDRLRQHFLIFVRARSGTRFRAYHRRRQARPHLLRTGLAIGAGLLLILIGIVLLVLPGPGLLIAAAGAALIAGESLLIARLLDRLDFCATMNYARWRRGRSEHL